MESNYTIRNDVVSENEKIMKEKICIYLSNLGWKRKEICGEKYKTIIEWTTPEGDKLLHHIIMRERNDTGNAFINADVYGEIINHDDYLITLSDIRQEISPTFIWKHELSGKFLNRKNGNTPGNLIPDTWFHTMKEFEYKGYKC